MATSQQSTEVSRDLWSCFGHLTSPGPLFLIPGLVIALHVCGRTLRPEQVIEMRRYLLSKRRKEGGWGLCVVLPFA
jgi:lanosterol synthase